MLNILLVDFPFIDTPEQSKARPGLALTEPIGKHQLVIVAYITSYDQDILETTVNLELTQEELATAGLTKSSTIVLHKLTSIDQKNIHGQLGILPAKQEKEVRKKLRKLFAI